jgi:hypothetical protein
LPHRAPARDVRRIAKDPEALEVFYRAHVDRVQRFVARRTADPYLVADLTAEVFLAAIESAQTYRSRLGDPGNWLYGIARNVVAAEVRTNPRERRTASRISGRALVQDDDVADLLDRIDAQARAREIGCGRPTAPSWSSLPSMGSRSATPPASSGSPRWPLESGSIELGGSFRTGWRVPIPSSSRRRCHDAAHEHWIRGASACGDEARDRHRTTGVTTRCRPRGAAQAPDVDPAGRRHRGDGRSRSRWRSPLA